MSGAAQRKDDDELVPVGPGVPETEAEDVQEKGTDREKGEAGEREEDDRLAHAEDDADERADGDGRAERKHETWKERKQRQRVAKERDKRELNFLRQRIEQVERRNMELEGRTSRSEVAAIDSRIGQLETHIATADQVIAEAIKQQKGDDAVEATRIRDQLRDQLAQLKGVKQAASQTAPSAPRIDPAIEANANAWLSQHEWFDPRGTDEDSQIVKAIDNAVKAEGFDPASRDYWQELTRRVRRRLPDRFTSKRAADDDVDDLDPDVDDRPSGKNGNHGAGGPRFSSGGRERSLRKNEVYVSPERVSAMKELGVWDDPVLRKRYLTAYKRWDEENRQAAH